MNPLRAALQLPLALPAYWRRCRAVRATMNCTAQKVSYGSHSRQYYLQVEPPAANLRPGHYAFYLHGGGWTFGRPEAFVPAAQPWLDAGYRMILPSYRRPPHVGLHRIMEDCRAAIRHAAPAEPVVDVQIGGISAGAHLAALLAPVVTDWTDAGWGRSPSAVLACAGPHSFADLWPVGLAMSRYYAALNPVEVLPPAGRTAPRWLLLHGTKDATVASVHSEKFYRVLRQKGYAAELGILPGATHLGAGEWMFGGPLRARVDRFIAGCQRS